MTNYATPWEQRWAADQADMQQQLRTLRAQVANLTSGPVGVPSSQHPASPWPGMPIYETDTGLTAYWSGTAWVYPPQLIARTVLAATTASVTFSSIPQVFANLKVLWTARSDAGGTATYMCVRLNADSASSYDDEFNQANNATNSSANGGGTVTQIQIGTMAASGATANQIGSGEFSIPSAVGSTWKAPAGFSNSANSSSNGFSGTYGGTWRNTAAVTSMTFLALAGNLALGSWALYGM